MKIVILDTTFDLTVKGLYSLVRHAAILIIAPHRSITEINSAVDVTCSIKICIKVNRGSSGQREQGMCCHFACIIFLKKEKKSKIENKKKEQKKGTKKKEKNERTFKGKKTKEMETI